MGDTRKKGMVKPLAFETMRIFEMAGFKTKEIIIKEQHNCKATGYWKTNSIKYNFLLLTHEYLFVFKKIKTGKGIQTIKLYKSITTLINISTIQMSTADYVEKKLLQLFLLQSQINQAENLIFFQWHPLIKSLNIHG